jgi:hypothetical protein
MPDAPRWLLEAFRDGVDDFAHNERPLMGYMPYAGAWPGCFLANFDTAKIPCSGQQERYERFHFIPRQRVEKIVADLLYTANFEDPFRLLDIAERREIVALAAWDARNGGLGCEHHHRRYDSHAHSPQAPRIVVPAMHLPEHVDDFIVYWCLEVEAERRFEGYRPGGDRAYKWRPSRR